MVQLCPALDILILYLYFDLILDRMFKTFSKSTFGVGNIHFIFDTKTCLLFWWRKMVGEGSVGGSWRNILNLNYHKSEGNLLLYLLSHSFESFIYI